MNFYDENHWISLNEALRLQLRRCRRVLDLGCGDNTTLAPYRTRDREVWGTDFQAHPGLTCPEWFRLLGPSGQIQFPDTMFDLVVSIMVMEHVVDRKAFFGEVARVLKPGGLFIGHSISADHYVTWLSRMFGLLPHSIKQRIVKKLYGRNEVGTFKTHYRLNRPRAIDRAARAVGMKRIELRRYADAGYFSIFPRLIPVVTILDRTLARLSPSWGQLYFTVILEKPKSSTASAHLS